MRIADNKSPELFCVFCGREIQQNPRGKKQKTRFCSKGCGLMWHSPRDGSGLPTATAGALHELLVCVDLLARGFHVFRNVSPVGSVDLVAVGVGPVYTIQVKKAGRNLNGQVTYCKRHADVSDILALSFSDRSICYLPRPPVLAKTQAETALNDQWNWSGRHRMREYQVLDDVS